MKYAVVHKDKVTNVIEWDGKTRYKPAEGKLVKADKAVVAPGYSYKDGKFIEPAQRDIKSK